MSIKIACPQCDRMHTLADDLAGKKIRCKGCDRSFLVKSEDEANDIDDDEEERKPKRSKRRRKNAGIPVWVWAAVGGGAALVLGLILVVVIVVVVGSGSPAANPKQAKGPDGKVNPQPMGNKPGDLPPGPAAPPGPHVAIMEEFGVSWNAAADAIASARDQGSAAAAAARLQQEATKVNGLAQRWRAAGRPAAADEPRLRQIEQILSPSIGRMETEARSLSQRLPGMRLPNNTLREIDQAMNAFSTAGKNMVAAAR